MRFRYTEYEMKKGMFTSSRILLSLSCILLFSCEGKRVSVGEESKSTGEHTVRQVMPGQGPVDAPGHGQELWFAVAPLAGVGLNANGVAQAHYLQDNSSIATVQLNIERAGEGSFYEAWLVDPDSSKRISLGHLRTPFGDVRHSLKFVEDVDVRGYSRIEVTKELDDGDPEPTEVVAEGVLKERKR